MIARLPLAALVIALATTGHAAPSARETQLAAQARAAAARVQEQALAQGQTAALARLRQAEAATDAAAEKIVDLMRRRAAVSARLAAREADIAPLVPALVHLHADPVAILASMNIPAVQALGGVKLLSALARQIALDASNARAEQAELADLQAAYNAELPRLAAAQVAQTLAAANLDQQIRRTSQARREAEDEAANAARQVAIEAAHAETVNAAVARIEAARYRRESAEPRKPDRVVATQGFMAPVAGPVTRHFGDATDSGAATGIAYQPAPGARVVAPCGGRVVYAGPFRSFGILLIIDCGRGTHAVLSGFDRLDAQVGHTIATGAPVGTMPGWDPHASAPRPALYVEIRRAGRAVDPWPLLAGKAGT
jgi:septal ring factor EnvC (AmiA/AmiB activator)